MNLYLSKKIKIASFFLIIQIVVLHGYNLVIHYHPGKYFVKDQFNFLLQNFISDGICRIAVPLFFMISGYLYFINIQEQFQLHHYLIKLKRRFHSVLIPFLVWSTMGVVALFIMINIPELQIFFYKYSIQNFAFPEIIDLWLVNPINYQLWFLQVLFLFCMISPVFYLLVKAGKYAVFLLLPLLFVNFPYGFLLTVTIEGFLFFAMGAYLALRPVNFQFIMSKKHLLLFFLTWIGLIAFKIYLHSRDLRTFSVHFEKLSMLPGIVFFWFALDYLYHYLRNMDFRASLFSYSFFIFLFHEPTLIIIKKLMLIALGVNPMGNFITYLLAPLFTIGLALIVAKSLKKYLPRIYLFLTGSR